MTPTPGPVPLEQFHNPLPDWVYIVGLALFFWLLWRLERWWFNRAPCLGCGGRGRWRSPWGVKAWRRCAVCGGSGDRPRGKLR